MSALDWILTPLSLLTIVAGLWSLGFEMGRDGAFRQMLKIQQQEHEKMREGVDEKGN